MANQGILRQYAGGGKIKDAVSPLAQLIATRMAGQLEAVPHVLPDMGPLSKINLPAAYAGDQRSLQAAQRGINEAETGLASPGRRKILKQGAGTAARSLIPDSVVNTLATQAGKALMEPVAIPDEAIQAAITAQMRKALKSKATQAFVDDGGWLDDAETVIPDMMANPEGYGMTARQVAQFAKHHGDLHPSSIAQAFGLPEDAVNSYLEKVGQHPQQTFADWLSEPGSHEAFMDEPAKHWAHDYKLGEIPVHPHPEVEAAFREKLKKGMDMPDGPYSTMDNHAKFMDDLLGHYYEGHLENMTKSYQDLLGPSNYHKLRRSIPIDPTRYAGLKLDEAIDAGLQNDAIDKLLGDYE